MGIALTKENARLQILKAFDKLGCYGYELGVLHKNAAALLYKASIKTPSKKERRTMDYIRNRRATLKELIKQTEEYMQGIIEIYPDIQE